MSYISPIDIIVNKNNTKLRYRQQVVKLFKALSTTTFNSFHGKTFARTGM